MGDSKTAAAEPHNDAARLETTPCVDARLEERANATRLRAQKTQTARAQRDVDYRVICISTYDDDLAALDAKVTALKAAGWSKANRSHLIRIAVAELTNEQIAEIAAIKKGRR